MSAYGITVPTSPRPSRDPKPRPGGTKDCSCECGGTCEESCCSLECLERPRFYCGQPLNDTDLNAIVTWTRDKARLARFRDGWGVACGLEVRCDPKVPSGVIVGTGYAVSCCGDDIVVCEDTPLDLADLCAVEDPCADPALPKREPLRGGRAVQVQSRVRQIGRPDRGTGDSIEVPTLADRPTPSTLRAFDVYVRYRESLSHPQSALGHRDCHGSGSECEYARTQESFEVYAEAALEGTDPMSARARAWAAGYDACLSVVDQFIQVFGPAEPSSSTDAKGRDRGTDAERHAGDKRADDHAARERADRGEAIRRWLVRWIERHDPYQFCYLNDEICDMTAEALTGPDLVRILFLLAQDCRNAYIACDCHACTEPSRVPIARVWLDVAEDRGREACLVACVDGFAPYRRLLSKDCWPAPLGKTNLGRAIWQPRPGVQATLVEVGVTVVEADVEADEFVLPDTVGGLRDGLNRMDSQTLFVDPGGRVRAVVYNGAQCAGSSRVIGFLPAKWQPTRTDDSPSVAPAADRPDGAGEREVPTIDVRPASPVRPIEEIRGLGGKRGEILRARGITTTNQLRELSVLELAEMIPNATVTTLKRFIAESG